MEPAAQLAIGWVLCLFTAVASLLFIALVALYIDPGGRRERRGDLPQTTPAGVWIAVEVARKRAPFASSALAAKRSSGRQAKSSSGKT